MSEIIRSISVKKDLPIVKFDRSVSEGSTISSVFPGSGSEPVLPSPQFENAIADVVAAIAAEYSLSPDWEWSLEIVSFDWDAEGDEYGFKAVLSSFLPELGTQKITVAQSSPSHVPPSILKCMEKLEQEAIAFVGGASAQGSLFDQGFDISFSVGDVLPAAADADGRIMEAIA